jgi:predicted nucleic acid-binding protein
MVIVDSDVIIWVLRGDATYQERFAEMVRSEKGKAAVTPVQYAEIMAGVKEKERAVTEVFLESFICLPIDANVGLRAGEYLHRYAKSHSVHLPDALVAASVSLGNHTLWTANTKHYPMLHAADLYRNAAFR